MNCSTGELLVSRMMGTLRGALDDLPEQPRLALWFSLCLKLPDEETSDITRIPSLRLSRVVDRGVRDVLKLLAANGIITDCVSIKAALPALAGERAGPLVFRRIVSCALDGGGRMSSLEPVRRWAAREVFDRGRFRGSLHCQRNRGTGLENDGWN